MTDPLLPGSAASVDRSAEDRLDSWKEIAAYLKRDVTTVQRWEKREGMPVHRHVHDKIGSVYAFRSDLDAWTRSRKLAFAPAAEEPQIAASPRRIPARVALAAGAVLVAALLVWLLAQRPDSAEDPLADARVAQVTDFGGAEQAAAISRDGRFVAFISNRDGQMDVWVTQVGTGQFYNLTRGAAREVINQQVRALGFSPDGSLVTFWTREVNESGGSETSVWAVPVLGGQPRPYLDGIAEFDWSNDDGRLVYHTSAPGDPMFIREPGQSGGTRQIFSAPAGLHSHFPIWSPDDAFIYFVQGTVPDRMDIWRIRPDGTAVERITTHVTVVTHPVFLDDRTLMYLATDTDGSGPWLHSVDVDRRVPYRLNRGVDRFTALAASADGRRIAATVARPSGALWRVPVASLRAAPSPARRVSLTTGNGSAPRLGAGYLLYVSSKGASDGIWKLQGDVATEIWSAPDARIVGGPAISRREDQVAFSVRQYGQTLLYTANIDGSDARVITSSLRLDGPPAWSPDGRSLTVSALVGDTPRLFSVPLDGTSPAPFGNAHAADPAWSPDGRIVVFSGPDVGTTFPLGAVTADGAAHPLPKVMLSRGARHLFMPGQHALIVLRGDLQHKDLWSIDLETGTERQLTQFAPDFNVRDFDISPDGREIVLEQVQERSDVVLLDLPVR